MILHIMKIKIIHNFVYMLLTKISDLHILFLFPIKRKISKNITTEIRELPRQVNKVMQSNLWKQFYRVTNGELS